MKRFAIALLGLAGLISAKPAFLSLPLTYATLTPVPRAATNGGGPRNPEVTVAGMRAARFDEEETNLSDEAAVSRVAQQPPRQHTLVNVLASAAPLGADGRVVDTAEVAAAKAAHAAAHLNERLNLAYEAARSGATDSSEITTDITTSETLFGQEDGVPDTPDVTAHVNEKINYLANEAAGSAELLTRLPTRVNGPLVPLVLGNGRLVATLVPVDNDGRPLNAPEVAARDYQNLRSVDALAVAGPALAYGRLVY